MPTEPAFGAETEIIIPGAWETVKENFRKHVDLTAETQELLDAPGVRPAIRELTVIGDYLIGLGESGKHDAVKPTLMRLSELQLEQLLGLRQIVDSVITGYSYSRGLDTDKLKNAYWGSGNDEFAVGLPGWWHYISAHIAGEDYFPTDWADSGKPPVVWVGGNQR